MRPSWHRVESGADAVDDMYRSVGSGEAEAAEKRAEQESRGPEVERRECGDVVPGTRTLPR